VILHNRMRACILIIMAAVTGLGLKAEESTKESSAWEIALNIRTTIRAGIMGEHVYSGDDTLSHLEWELLPLVTVGPSIAFFTRFNTEARLTIELPVFRATGQMTDADYLDPTDRSTPTKLSTHHALVDSHRAVDVSLKQTVASSEKAAILIGLGYVDRFVKMIGYEGEFDYGSLSGEVTGVPITYQQHHRIPYLSLSIRSDPRMESGLGLSLEVSPYVLVDAVDHHHLRLIDFFDTVRGARWFRGEIGISMRLLGQRVELAGFGEIIPETRGETYSVKYTEGSFVSNTSPTTLNGAGISWWNAGISASIRFGL